MSLRFCSLGSGSEGNALIVEAASHGRATRVMLDCGFSLAETERRLHRAGLQASEIDAIVVTHEHSDHIGGVARFARKHGTAVWLTHGTARGWADRGVPSAQIHYIDPHATFAVGALEVHPITVPHDAYEPTQAVFSDGCHRLGVLTDLGTVTAHVEESLDGCDALVLETNHDLDMLMTGPYPDGLKKRVAGKFGHLDNQAAAALLRNLDCSRLKHVIAAHLSKQNNRPPLAVCALAGALHCEERWIGVADQATGFDWRAL